MSKSELARRSGIKPQTLWVIEANQTMQMLAANLFRLADALGVDARELYLGPGRDEPARTVPHLPDPNAVYLQMSCCESIEVRGAEPCERERASVASSHSA
jgi:transcriptional regulator with XRE-family HTH domain